MPTSAAITLFETDLTLAGLVARRPLKYCSRMRVPRCDTSRLYNRGSSDAALIAGSRAADVTADLTEDLKVGTTTGFFVTGLFVVLTFRSASKLAERKTAPKNVARGARFIPRLYF